MAVWFGLIMILIKLVPENNALFLGLFMLASVLIIVPILILLKKGAASEFYLKRQRFIKKAEPYIQSCRPITEYEHLAEQIKSELEADGLTVVENIELFPGVKPTIAYRKIGIGTFNYFFLIHDNTAVFEYANLEKVRRAIERIRISDSSLLPSDYVILAVFVDTAEPEMIKHVMDYFSYAKTTFFFMAAVYELQTGKVYFMNGKAPRFSVITHLQNLIKKYFAGEPMTKR